MHYFPGTKKKGNRLSASSVICITKTKEDFMLIFWVNNHMRDILSTILHATYWNKPSYLSSRGVSRRCPYNVVPHHISWQCWGYCTSTIRRSYSHSWALLWLIESITYYIFDCVNIIYIFNISVNGVWWDGRRPYFGRKNGLNFQLKSWP